MIGDVVGSYRIVGLGSGGVGDVFLADDTRRERRVAIKVLPAAFAADHIRMGTFERQARTVSALDHPGICTLLDGGFHEGRPFLVMEALDGQTLAALIGARPLATDRVLDIGMQVAAGLAGAHDAGVVHRALSASNIFVTRDGGTKILDFGIAELAAATATPADVSYLAPEQARGEAADARADLFALGVVLYQCVTGTLPFEGATSDAVLDQILHHAPESVISRNPRLPAGLVSLIGRALAKDPAERFATAHEMMAGLEAIRRAPGSLEFILPAEHISSSAAVTPPPRPIEQTAPGAAGPESGIAGEPAQRRLPTEPPE